MTTMKRCKCCVVLCRVFSIPCISFALIFSLLVVPQIRGHIVGSSAPSLPTTVRASHFYRGRISARSDGTQIPQFGELYSVTAVVSPFQACDAAIN